MVIYMRAVEILGASRMGVLTAFSPITSALLAVPVLGEPLTLGLLISLALVSSGVLVGNATSLPFLRRAQKCPM
jgi:drug/metabolite transporter (DMT)-like permease